MMWAGARMQNTSFMHATFCCRGMTWFRKLYSVRDLDLHSTVKIANNQLSRSSRFPSTGTASGVELLLFCCAPNGSRKQRLHYFRLCRPLLNQIDCRPPVLFCLLCRPLVNQKDSRPSVLFCLLCRPLVNQVDSRPFVMFCLLCRPLVNQVDSRPSVLFCLLCRPLVNQIDSGSSRRADLTLRHWRVKRVAYVREGYGENKTLIRLWVGLPWTVHKC